LGESLTGTFLLTEWMGLPPSEWRFVHQHGVSVDIWLICVELKGEPA